jgi:hypothetical protein
MATTNKHDTQQEWNCEGQKEKRDRVHEQKPQNTHNTFYANISTKKNTSTCDEPCTGDPQT